MARGIFRYSAPQCLEQAALATCEPGLHDPASMKMLVRPLLLVLGFAVAKLGAQVPGPSPLAPENAADRAVPGGWIAAEHRADQALQNGFPATAAGIYRELLLDRSLPVDLRQRVGLAQVTALMDSGDTTAAEQALQNYDGPRHSAYQLRVGLLAVMTRRVAQVRAALAAGKPDELTETDRGWWYFLQAGVADLDGDIVQANSLYEQAARTAVSELQRARFVLGQMQARLRNGQLSEAQLNTLRSNMDRFQGTRTGYDAARSYATALAGLGRSLEAQAVLDRQLVIIPPTERNVVDQFRLMLGLIAGDRSQTGRQAFRQLLRNAQLPETQRIALQLLVRGAGTPAERDQLRRDLTELIGAPTQHAIIEDLLLARAQLELADKLYAAAEEDARALLDRYPGSTLKPSALGVWLAVAWDLKRYRAAANVIAQLRGVIAPGRQRAELGVLLAEAWFRAGADAEARGADGKGEFRNAADAYEAALHEAPLAAPAGVLIFQRALAEIRADRLEAAAKQLDDAAADAGFDAVSRWQAEWNLIKEMQVRGQTAEAAARVEKLLASGTAGVPEELRIRLMWLRAKLSFDNGQPDAALRQADELLTALPKTPQLDETLRTNVTSTTQLLKAQALLAREHDTEGAAILDKLRADYHATGAAQYSYLVQAGYLTQRGDLAGAQRVLINFVDTAEYRKSEYAPLALYQAAILLERRGLDGQLRDAYNLLERLVHDYGNDDLVFRARLKQGDLMRKLNDFGTARQLYEDLINNYSQHPDVLLAQLALADTLFAQGANNLTNYESAATIFERLRDLPSAPVDLRAEAGFKWGTALAKRGQTAKAQAVFWSVVNDFLLDTTQAAKLGATGRWWVSKSLLELAQIHEDAGRLDEAQRTYQLIVDNKLSGLAIAQSKLARFRPAVTTTP
jgi:cellulose synthase operon protein C